MLHGNAKLVLCPARVLLIGRSYYKPYSMSPCRGCWLPAIFTLFSHLLFAQQGITYNTNPHGYWYFLSPTGFAPAVRKTTYDNGLLAISQFQKTKPNGTTTALGMVPTLLLGEKYMPVWVSAHRRFPIGGNALRPAAVFNVGGFFLSLPNNRAEGGDQDFSLFYANLTFGNREHNIAIGAAIAPTGFGKNVYPKAFTLHGLTRLGQHSCLVTENYILYDEGDWIPCSLTGWRRWWNRTSLDLALFVTGIPSNLSVKQGRQWLPLPWIAVHHTFRFDLFSHGDE